MQLDTHLVRISTGAQVRAVPTEFVLRLQDRDPQAWEELFNHWFPKLYAYALHSTGDAAAAQDLASETFARAFRDIHRFGQRGTAVGTWLYTIAHHRVVDFQRQRARTKVVGLDAAENLAAMSDEQPDPSPAEDGSGRLLHAVQELPPDQRAVVLLRFYGRLTGQETADILGKSHGAVRQLQFRALRNLRTILAALPDQNGRKGASR
ncbi:MAG: RNA polymerase sigma factor [Dehalococcoidia bacterium]|nr:RNA polymerase sigma factor [Dehalococcoidia bacterium]